MMVVKYFGVEAAEANRVANLESELQYAANLIKRMREYLPDEVLSLMDEEIVDFLKKHYAPDAIPPVQADVEKVCVWIQGKGVRVDVEHAD